jgi:tetratricopeptide (TPR) repeat protein
LRFRESIIHLIFTPSIKIINQNHSSIKIELMKTRSITKATFLLGLFFSLICLPIIAQNTLTTKEWQEDLRFLQSSVHTDYPFLFKKVTANEFDTAVEKLYREIPNMEAHEVPVAFARIVSLFKYGHSQVTYTAIANGTALPVNLYEFTDGIFIEGAHVAHKEVVGAKVIAIEGIPIKEALEMIRPVVPVENESYFKAFGLRFVTVPAVLHAQGITKQLSENIRLTLEKGGKQFTHDLGSIPLSEMSEGYNFTIPTDTWISARDQSITPLHLKGLNERVFYFEYLKDEKTVYARQSKVRNDRTETLASFYARLFTFIETNDVERLVYDVRHNGGGNNFLNKPFIKGLIRSDKLNKNGSLFVITGRRTFSAAQNLVNEIDNYTSAVFVGEPTAENINFYGDARPVTMPNSKINAYLSFAWWQDKPQGSNGDWLYPDVSAALSFEDFKTNKDPMLEAALSYDPSKNIVDPMEYLTELFVNGEMEKVRSEAIRLFKDPNYGFFDFENNFNGAGRNLMGGANHIGAVMILELNTELFPDSANAWSSLGDAHRSKDSTDKAKACYEKAISLDPAGKTAAYATKMLDLIKNK